MNAVLRGRRRRILAAAALAVLLGCGLLLGVARHAAADTGGGDERCDIIGENHHGVLSVLLDRVAVFPERALILTMPSQSSFDASRIHVFEDCQAVAVTVTALSSTRYEIHYRSARPFGERNVELGVQVDGVDKADIDYNAPAAVAAEGATAGHSSFWGSSLAKIVVPAAAGLLCALALVLFLVPGRRRRDVRARIAEFAPEPESGPQNPRVLAPAVARYVRMERLLARTGWWPAFKESAEIARLGRSAVELVMIDAAATLALAALLGLAGVVPLAVLALLLGPFALHALVRWGVRRQQALFADQLPSHLDEFASALRAGHGLAAGLAASLKSAPEPSRSEWARVVSDEALGTPLDDAMRTLARRMASEDVEQLALVASLHQRTGGNVAEIIDRVTDGVRERAELRREVRALTAQARMTRWILLALPPGVIGLITVMSTDYMKPLFTTAGGIVALVLAGTLLLIGSLILRKLTEIKV
jgi:tight adherence protein B